MRIRNTSVFARPCLWFSFLLAWLLIPPAAAQLGWGDTDIGAVAAAGSGSESGGVITVRGSGADIWSTDDEFHYRYISWTGDGTFTVRVTGITNTDAWAKAGLMIRPSLAADSPHVLAAVNPNRYAHRVYRTTTGGSSAFNAILAESSRYSPMWLRVTRAGDTIATFFSANGINWQPMANGTFAFPQTVFVGLAVTSHNDGTLCTATFDNLTFRSTGPTGLTGIARAPTRIDLRWRDDVINETRFELERSPDNSAYTMIASLDPESVAFSDHTVAPSSSYYYRVRAITPGGPTDYSNFVSVSTPPPSPAGWSSLDIGDTAATGQSTASGGAFSISGAGAGVGGVTLNHVATGQRGDFSYTVPGYSDEFQFCYQPWTGEGEIVARLTGLSGHENAHAGIMIRGGLGESGFNVFYHQRAAGLGVHVSARSGTDATDFRFRNQTSLRYSNFANNASPLWLKLVRAGDGVMAYSSPDGTNWTEISWVTVPLFGELQFGLGVSSRQDGTSAGALPAMATGTFDNVAIRAVTTPVAPMVAPSNLTATANGTDSITLNWTNHTTSVEAIEVERSINGGGFSFRARLAWSTTSYTDVSLSGGTTYAYRVRAIRGSAATAYSNTATATTGGVPAAPTNLGGVANSPTHVILNWTDNATNETAYGIERSTDNMNFWWLADTTANTIRFDDFTTNPATTYYYRVYAVNGAGISGYSNVFSVTTQGTAAPSAPTGLTATAVSPTRVDLRWTDNSTTEDMFEIERSMNDFNYSPVGTVGANITQFSDVSVNGSNTYYYRVSATNASGGRFSNTASVTTPATPPTGETWQSRDIGAVSAAGSSSESGGIITVRGSGADIWDRADEFHYRYQPWIGNFQITIRVTGLTNTNAWAKAGIMARETLNPDSRHAFICLTPQGVAYQGRRVTGGTSETLMGTSTTAPRWLRLVRQGGEFSSDYRAYESADGVNWTQVGSMALDLPNAGYIGFAVTSHNDGTVCTATFDNFQINDGTATPPPPAPGPLNAPTGLSVEASAGNWVNLSWTDNSDGETRFEVERGTNGVDFTPMGPAAENNTRYVDATVSANQTYHYRVRAARGTERSAYATAPGVTTPMTMVDNIGPVGASGEITGSGSTIRIMGSGADIWGSADEFRYYHLRWSGAGEIIVRVTGLGNTNGWAKAGVMFRESLAADSRHVMVCVSPANGTALQGRLTTAGASFTTAGSSSNALPKWLKLTRNGSTFVAAESTNGSTWTQVGAPVTLDLPNSIYVGLAVTSHNDGVLTVANFDNLQWPSTSSPPPPPPPPPPSSPSAPTNLTATVRSSSQIDLSWVDTSSNETGFEVESSRDNVTFTLLTTVAANATALSNGGLSESTTYYYRVRAISGAGNSLYSNVANGTTTAAPPPSSSWSRIDVGNVAVAGSASGSGSSFTVSGSGADIWGNADEFQYMYQGWNGDGTFIARVTGMTNTHTWAKAGIMLRESLGAGAQHVMVAVNPGNAAGFFRRTVGNGPTDFNLSVYEIPQMWIRLIRTGNSFQAAQSPDGVTWYNIGSTLTLNLPSTVFVGLAVTSHNDGVLCTANFTNVAFTGGTPPPPAAVNPPSGVTTTIVSSSQVNLSWSDNSNNETKFEIERSTDNEAFVPVAEVGANVTSYSDSGLSAGTTYYYRVRAMAGSTPSSYSASAPATTTGPPPPPASTWQQADIGSVGVAGSNEASGNRITVRGSGSDIWDTADAFRFVYREMSGDCTVEAQIVSLTNTHAWAKAGVMIRASSAANAANVFLCLNPSNVMAFSARATAGGVTAQPAGPWWVSPGYWVRLVRAGNTFSAYSSPDGTNWTLRSTTTVSMGTSVLVGFAVTSHNNTTLATGTFADPFIE